MDFTSQIPQFRRFLLIEDQENNFLQKHFVYTTTKTTNWVLPVADLEG